MTDHTASYTVDDPTAFFRIAHVVPVRWEGDSRQHVLSVDCWCHPIPDINGFPVLMHRSYTKAQLQALKDKLL